MENMFMAYQLIRDAQNRVLAATFHTGSTVEILNNLKRPTNKRGSTADLVSAESSLTEAQAYEFPSPIYF